MIRTSSVVKAREAQVLAKIERDKDEEDEDFKWTSTPPGLFQRVVFTLCLPQSVLKPVDTKKEGDTENKEEELEKDDANKGRMKLPWKQWGLIEVEKVEEFPKDILTILF